MRADRWLLLAVLFLGCGLWALFAYCHGTAGLSFALPFSASTAALDVKTTGAAVWIGVPLTIIGLILLLAAIAFAIMAQFRNPHRAVREEKPLPPAPRPAPPTAPPPAPRA